MTAEAVTVPQEHAGVGAALRAAFAPHAPNLPEDLAKLIVKLG